MTTQIPAKPLIIYVFSHPRTGSNLFCKLFSQHPSINQELYKYLFEFLFGPELQTQFKGKEADELIETHKDLAKDLTYQASLDFIQNLVVKSEQEVSRFYSFRTEINAVFL